MNQKTHLRNEVELSPQRFLAESSTKGVSAQDLRSKFQPIYHMTKEIAVRGRSLIDECEQGTAWQLCG